jgi:hypothetical protein
MTFPRISMPTRPNERISVSSNKSIENMPFLPIKDIADAKETGGTNWDKLKSLYSMDSRSSTVAPNASAVAMIEPTEHP